MDKALAERPVMLLRVTLDRDTPEARLDAKARLAGGPCVWSVEDVTDYAALAANSDDTTRPGEFCADLCALWIRGAVVAGPADTTR